MGCKFLQLLMVLSSFHPRACQDLSTVPVADLQAQHFPQLRARHVNQKRLPCLWRYWEACVHSLCLTHSGSPQTREKGSNFAHWGFPQVPLRSEESGDPFKDLTEAAPLSESNRISLPETPLSQALLTPPSLAQVESHLKREFQEETISGSRAGLLFHLKLEQSG